MEAIYSIPIFVSLTLIAIMIAVFVFASSFYKGSLELCTKEEEDALNRRKELINSKRKELIEKIGDVDESAFPKELRTELDKLDTELKKVSQSIAKSRNKAKALTVVNIVVIPASFLVASIVTSGIAITTSGTLPTTMFVISLVLIAISVCLIFRNLFTIESLSKVTDLGTLMEQALDRHRIKSTPILEMELPDFQLEIPRGETREIMYFVSLKQGVMAKNARVRLSGTEELDFPDEKIKQLGFDYANMRNPKEFWQGFQDVNPKVHKRGIFNVKAPDKKGEYTMAYWLQCDEYTADEITFKIKVI